MKPQQLLNLVKTDQATRLYVIECLEQGRYKELIQKYNLASRNTIYKLHAALGTTRTEVSLHWFTNGVNDIQLVDGAEIPAGYYAGRTNFGKGTAGTRWANNGTETILIKAEQELPEGFSFGSLSKSTSGYIWVNNGVKDRLVPESERPAGFNFNGRINTQGYVESGKRRKLHTYNNGKTEIRLTVLDQVPEGFVKGALPKLTPQERIQKRDEEYHAKGYIGVKELTQEQLRGYIYYRDNSSELVDIIIKPDTYTYINKKYLPLFEEYANTNHSKGTSNAEQSLYEYIRSIYPGEIKRHVKNLLKESSGKYYEIDIYIPALKIGIEYNGLYWHSELQKEKNYHFKKSKLADELGIRLINIYEDEWEDQTSKTKIQTLLKISLGLVEQKIHARKCEIKEITNAEARPFNEANHLQGHRNAQLTYGLFYQGKLVQLMSFSKTRYNRNLKADDSWEIIRGCPGSNNIVVGGVSKLLQHFIKENNPASIFSYCDFNKFNGVSYEKAGMKFEGYTGPDMTWWIGDRRIPRQPKKHAELKQQATCRIFGSGSKKYRLILR